MSKRYRSADGLAVRGQWRMAIEVEGGNPNERTRCERTTCVTLRSARLSHPKSFTRARTHEDGATFPEYLALTLRPTNGANRSKIRLEHVTFMMTCWCDFGLLSTLPGQDAWKLDVAHLDVGVLRLLEGSLVRLLVLHAVHACCEALHMTARPLVLTIEYPAKLHRDTRQPLIVADTLSLSPAARRDRYGMRAGQMCRQAM